MSGRPPFIKNLAEVERKPYSKDKGAISGEARDIGEATGTERLGIDVNTIPPGKNSSYLHHHKHKEEFFYVLRGRCRVKVGGETYDLGPDDCVARPAGSGVPHQFSNPFDEPCDVIMIGVPAGRGVEDEIHWPELGRVLNISPEGERRIGKTKGP